MDKIAFPYKGYDGYVEFDVIDTQRNVKLPPPHVWVVFGEVWKDGKLFLNGTLPIKGTSLRTERKLPNKEACTRETAEKFLDDTITLYESNKAAGIVQNEVVQL
jgi:hypothetical protein